MTFYAASACSCVIAYALPSYRNAGTADVASAHYTMVATMSKVITMLGVAAKPYTEEPEHVVVAAGEV